LHHLCYHGPITALVEAGLPPDVDGFLGRSGMVVHCFLVVAGFLAARGLMRGAPASLGAVLAATWQRYLRIGAPYAVALALAVVANAWARSLAPDESISAPATWHQFLAHVTYLHVLLGYESLTTGVWYLAVDFQLGLLTLLVAWVGQHVGRLTSWNGAAVTRGLLVALGVTSLAWFNRVAALDGWAIYFLGSYVVGMVLAWSMSGTAWWGWAWVAVAAAAVVGHLDDRPRPVVAATTALCLLLVWHAGAASRWPTSRVLGFLGRISYAIFLVHFPVYLVVVSLARSTWAMTPNGALLVVGVSYAASVAVAAAFHALVEVRLVKALKNATSRRPQAAM
jgi:peptidoglycan/LPS O-acetylase OafA/YrhL